MVETFNDYRRFLDRTVTIRGDRYEELIRKEHALEVLANHVDSEMLDNAESSYHNDLVKMSATHLELLGLDPGYYAKKHEEYVGRLGKDANEQ